MLKHLCDSFLDEAMEYNDLPGLVIGVSRQGEEFTGARGVRDVVTGDPLRDDDVFHCASISKLFTSSAIMKLVEAGVLDLNHRLSDILPDFSIADRRYEEIRLWQMLSHTAGIGDVTDYHWEQALTSDHALADYVYSDEVTGQPLLWAPGQGGFRYSNIAYEILGHIVSVKSAAFTGGRNLSYEEFVQEYLMEPAGMKDSTMLTFGRFDAKAGASFDGLITDEIRRRNAAGDPRWHPMALPHEKAEDRSMVPVRYYPYTRSHAPSSTLTSTVSDLLQWAQAHMTGFTAVKKEYAEVPNNREKIGLGWFMRRQGGFLLYGHEGSDDGFRSSFWICPELELGIVVLSNLSGAPVKKLNKKFFDRLLDQM